MPRPKNCRRVASTPGCLLFKPAGIPSRELEEIILEVDELEAIRLADLGGLYHEDAAERMNVSRQTFGRIIESARKKIAEALCAGKILRIEGGVIEMADKRIFKCGECGHVWEVPFCTGRPGLCPECQGVNFYRTEDNQGPNGANRGGRSRRQGRHQGICRRVDEKSNTNGAEK